MGSSPCSFANAPWSPRQILVDDTDPRITYTGNWTSHVEDGAKATWWGRSLYDITSHRLVLGNETSTLAFKFRGTTLNIVGTIYPLATNTSHVASPSISCRIDGQQRSSSVSGENLLCGIEGLDDGDHDVVFEASASGNSTSLGLAFDSIQYTPSLGQQLNTSDISIIDACDSSIDYRGHTTAWTFIDTPKNQTILNDTAPLGFKTRYKGVSTNQNGAQLSYTFTGRDIEWIGVYPGIQDGSPSRYLSADAEFAIWTAGNADSILTIHLPTNQTNQTEYDGILWGAYGLSEREHTLVATYKGGPGQAPLTFSYLNVPTRPLISPSHSPSHDGAIIGGVIGSFAGISLILVIAWFMGLVGCLCLEKRKVRKGLTWRPVSGGSGSKE